MDGMQSLKVGPRTYARDRDGTMTLPEADARAAVREGVAVRAGWADRARGYECPCGRRNYFRRCGGCGTET